MAEQDLGSIASSIEITVAGMTALIVGEDVVEGQAYRITDPSWAEWVVVQGTGTSTYRSLYALFLDPGYEDSGDYITNIWQPNSEVGALTPGDVKIWNGLRYELGAGKANTNTDPATDTTNWTVLPKSTDNGYVETIAEVEYSVPLEAIFGVGITKRVNKAYVFNEIYFGLIWSIMNGFANPVERFRWGGESKNMHCHVGLLDVRNHRFTSFYVYVQGGGEVSATDEVQIGNLWVEGGTVIASGTGTIVAARVIYRTTLTYSSDQVSNNIRSGLNQTIGISGSAKAENLYCEQGIGTIISLSGSANATSLTIKGSGTLTMSGTSSFNSGNLQLGGGAVTLSDSCILEDTEVKIDGGAGSLTVSGASILNNGYIRLDQGSITISNGAQLNKCDIWLKGAATLVAGAGTNVDDVIIRGIFNGKLIDITGISQKRLVITDAWSNLEVSVAVSSNTLDCDVDGLRFAGVITATGTTTLDTIIHLESLPERFIIKANDGDTLTLNSASATNIILPSGSSPINLVGANGDYVKCYYQDSSAGLAGVIIESIHNF